MSDNNTPDPKAGETGAASGADATPDAPSIPSGAYAAAPPPPPRYDAPASGSSTDANSSDASSASGYGAPVADAAPSYPGYPAPAADAAAAYGSTPYGAQGYPAPAYGTAPYGAQSSSGYGTQGYGTQGYGTQGYGSYAASARTNVLAIISLVGSIAGYFILPFAGPLVGVITGHIALAQIKRSGEKGRGLALTGVILGWVNIAIAAIFIAFVVIIAIAGASSSTYRY